jgi:adenine deaminase
MGLDIKILKIAKGEKKAPLVLKNGNIIDVFTGRIIKNDIAISGDKILGIGVYTGIKEIDCSNKYITSGLINCHCHVESSMVTPNIYALEELLWGTTTIITDPHEIANVAGNDGIDYMLSYCGKLPLNYYVQIPSCVPATPFEETGSSLDNNDLFQYHGHPWVIGLGEMMNVPGVINGDSLVWDKLNDYQDTIIDGHSPGLSGNSLNAYILGGIQTDHESTNFDEAIEKLSKGLSILVREGSACKNLVNILSGFIKENLDTTNMAFCTDDKHLEHIRKEGSIAHCIRLSIKMGLSPIKAIQMATINGARIYGLKKQGAIAPGYIADIAIWDNLEDMKVNKVIKSGEIVVENGMYIGETPRREPVINRISHSVKTPTLTKDSFTLIEKEKYPVINIITGEILTKLDFISYDNMCKEIGEGTLCKIAVIERYGKSGTIGIGLIRGYGLREGAVASTVAHDSHNLMVIGNSRDDMLLAAQRVIDLNGGYAYAYNGKIEGEVPLPIAGLMSNMTQIEINNSISGIISTIRSHGVGTDIDPLITLSFMALPVIPEVRITNYGMFDCVNFKFI